ncbi:inositol polyphosphate kinase domain containing protein [Neospora caninum Liverpool]|uniref:Kinase n=1 Tax=Neospora caninum (strain Liverpool) TaxID=572307 RepID=F0VJQ0_NEOCL|nr:inositol polyphosphate kinase domain containing protein [Neospora caninum Liverpool]CBZ53961.1 inositol polyphosphate kinase domain containing protein [Neospora caninum Liverpool]CEL67962.1 TPA: inositol polyphosphate kinase domain containing protein, putative [Neospora caninum Liverpool]|eukprot:XP_003883993.1 inositol polyphosphate kinase domain containing protein [Neospora caninum Liverpool]
MEDWMTAELAAGPCPQDKGGCAAGFFCSGHVDSSGSQAGTQPTGSEIKAGTWQATLAGGHAKNFRFSRDGLYITKRTHTREIEFYRWIYDLAGTPLPQNPSVHDESDLPNTQQSEPGSRHGKASGAASPTPASDEASGANEQPCLQRLISTDRSSASPRLDKSGKTEEASLMSKNGFSQNEWPPNAKRIDTENQARALKPWIPGVVCASVARAGDVPDSSGGSAESNEPEKGDTGGDGRKRGILVLANILHGMRWPVVVDLKMGTRTYRDEASPEKRERAKRYAEERGSASVGMAFCGLSAHRQDGTVVTVDGGSRAPRDCQHPRRLEDFVKVLQAFLSFVGLEKRRKDIGASLLLQLGELELALENLTIANFYGSSILLAYDAAAAEDSSDLCGRADAPPTKAQVKIVDFAHVTMMPKEPDLNGFLFGLRNLKSALQQAVASSVRGGVL